jgi:hypothetical protein
MESALVYKERNLKYCLFIFLSWTIHSFPINCRYVVENKVKGIRVWRVL